MTYQHCLSPQVRTRMISRELQELLVTELAGYNVGRTTSKLFLCGCTKLFLNRIKIFSFTGFFSLQSGQMVTELLQALCRSSWNWVELPQKQPTLHNHRTQMFQHGKNQPWNSVKWFCGDTRLGQRRWKPNIPTALLVLYDRDAGKHCPNQQIFTYTQIPRSSSNTEGKPLCLCPAEENFQSTLKTLTEFASSTAKKTKVGGQLLRVVQKLSLPILLIQYQYFGESSWLFC